MNNMTISWSLVLIGASTVASCSPPSVDETEIEPIPLITVETPVRFEVGVDTGAEDETIGNIRGVDIDDEGRILVLDDMARLIRFIDSEGEPLDAAGGIGRGPGEFIGLMGIGTGPNGTFAVVDGPQQRMTLGRAGPDGIAFEKIVRTGVFAFDVCLLDGLFVLNDPVEQGLLHLVDSTGTVLRSWGELIIESTPEMIRYGREKPRTQNKGRLLCDERRGRIYFVHRVLPFVRAFDRDGKELWRAELRGYHRQQYVIVNDRGRMSIRDNEESGSSHRALGAFLRHDTLVVSLQETSFPDRRGKHDLRFLNVDTGREAGRASVPMAVGASRGCLFIGFRNHPYPKVVGYQVDCEKGH